MLCQLVCVVGGQVSEPTILAPTPDLLIRVDFRSIGRQVLGHNLRMLRQVCLHHLGLPMDATAIPEPRLLANVTPDLAQGRIGDSAPCTTGISNRASECGTT